MTEHFDLESLAEFRAGNLPRRQAAGIRSHLAGCPDCTAAAGQVAAVTEAIARAPAAAMPPQVAARISAALAAEAQARAAGAAASSPGVPHAIPAQPAPAEAAPGQAAPARPAPVQAGAGSRPAGRPGTGAPAGRPGSRQGWRGRGSLGRQRNALRALAAAAVVMVVGGGGYAIAQLASPAGQPAASRASSRNPAASHPPASGLRNSGATAAGPLPTVASGTDYTRAGLAGQVLAVLDRHPATSAGRMTPRTGAARRPLNNLGTLQGCVTKITSGHEPRLVDTRARYQGRAVIVIVTAPAGGHQGMAWVAGADCSPSHPDVLARVALPARG
jgi:hypothetical protein